MNQGFISENIVNHVESWLSDSKRVGMAVLISATGSTPLPIGSIMAVNSIGESLGSVSGGCVEPTVVENIIEMLNDGPNRQSATLPVVGSFSYSDDVAFNFGLTCGGTVRIMVFEPHWDVYLPMLKNCIRASRSYMGIDVKTGHMVGICDTDGDLWYLYSTDGKYKVDKNADYKGESNCDCFREPMNRYKDLNLPTALFDVNIETLSFVKSDLILPNDSSNLTDKGIKSATSKQIFFYRFDGRPKLIIVGASDHVVALSRFGIAMGFEVYVVDPRPIFLNKSRFEPTANLIVKWPDVYLSEISKTITQRDVLCVLSHDDKFDIPTLSVALDLPFGYIGAMGSRRTTKKRIEKLRNAGIEEAKITAVRSPIGLDLGAQNSNEIALSIIAQIIAEKNGREGMALFETTGKITSDR